MKKNIKSKIEDIANANMENKSKSKLVLVKDDETAKPILVGCYNNNNLNNSHRKNSSHQKF